MYKMGRLLIKVGGWNETLYMQIFGISDSDVTAVSYNITGVAAGSAVEVNTMDVSRTYVHVRGTKLFW